jgi:hypothetical protein
MGNEIGSHSITHPENTNLLTDAQLQTEFQQSKLIIEQNFAAQGIKDPIDPTKPYLLAGAAIPGAPEKLAVSEKVMAYYDYLSGGNVQIGAGYPGAFGHMLPGDSKVYLAPNISSDFTLIEFKKMTPDQATAAWQQEWQDATAHASLPVVVFPWHDYGITGYVPGYNVQMFESLIKTAFDAGSEFVTLKDLAKRVSVFDTSSLTYDMVDADTISVNVGSSGSLGTFALDLSGQIIKSVAGSYAYDADSVFLTKSGGTFTIDLGVTPDDVTHITSLPSRAELLAATSPGGGGLDFSVIGEGTLLVDLEALNGRSVSVTGAQIASLTADKLALNLTGLGQHDVAVRLAPVSLPNAVPHDLDGNGTSDILWRHGDGTVVSWAMQGVTGTSGSIASVDLSWTLLGSADFNGDAKADLLWRGADGTVAQWQMNGTTYIGGGSFGIADLAWKVAAMGDMDGDGRADILWRNDDGNIAVWRMDGTNYLGGGGLGNAGVDWKVVGLDDFDGDRRADILWRHDDGTVAVWRMDGLTFLGGNTVGAPGAAWKIAGTGDTNGDGKADLVWRHDDGTVAVWIMDGLTPTAGATVAVPGAAWNVAAVGDYDGDRNADLLFRNTDGSISLWLMNGTAVASATSLGNPGMDWHVV